MMSTCSAESGDEAARRALAGFNALPMGEALVALRGCCSSQRWAGSVAATRPYGSVDEVLARSDAAVSEMTPADLADALAAHPRIGVAGGHGAAAWSRAEQAGVDSADAALARALAEGNRAYERRFGHIYLVCATGQSGPQLLTLLRDRLGNDTDTEWRVVAGELGKINRIRLRKLLEGGTLRKLLEGEDAE